METVTTVSRNQFIISMKSSNLTACVSILISVFTLASKRNKTALITSQDLLMMTRPTRSNQFVVSILGAPITQL